ncbi:MAG TPA: hypothetical protein EYG92_02670 [Lutibacter sp.]|nr:hypothetical protein [Lutibacter sp.]
MRYIYIFFLISTFSLNSQTTTNECLNKIYGQVIDKDTDEGIPNATIIITNLTGDISSITAKNDGTFYFELACEDTRYTITTTVENFTTSTKLIFLNKNIAKTQRFFLNLYPVKEFTIENGKKMIVAESIHFLPNETTIDSDSATILDEVFVILNKYPNIKIEIGFHTDSRGKEKYLLDLSKKRAQACAQYLEKKGIDLTRIISKGYGATQLLNECKKGVNCSNKKHLINRRSEFIVIP